MISGLIYASRKVAKFWFKCACEFAAMDYRAYNLHVGKDRVTIQTECATKRRLTWKRLSDKREDCMPALGRAKTRGREPDVLHLHENWC